MTHRLTLFALSVSMAGVLSLSAAPAHAGATAGTSTKADYKWEAGLFFSYLTGDYGQDQTTDLYYAAAMLKRYLGWGDATLTVPKRTITRLGSPSSPGSIGRMPMPLPTHALRESLPETGRFPYAPRPPVQLQYGS
jgi:hypothetical protein